MFNIVVAFAFYPIIKKKLFDYLNHFCLLHLTSHLIVFQTLIL